MWCKEKADSHLCTQYNLQAFSPEMINPRLLHALNGRCCLFKRSTEENPDDINKACAVAQEATREEKRREEETNFSADGCAPTVLKGVNVLARCNAGVAVGPWVNSH